MRNAVEIKITPKDLLNAGLPQTSICKKKKKKKQQKTTTTKKDMFEA